MKLCKNDCETWSEGVSSLKAVAGCTSSLPLHSWEVSHEDQELNQGHCPFAGSSSPPAWRLSLKSSRKFPFYVLLFAYLGPGARCASLPQRVADWLEIRVLLSCQTCQKVRSQIHAKGRSNKTIPKWVRGTRGSRPRIFWVYFVSELELIDRGKGLWHQ